MIERWPDITARSLHGMARQCLDRHDHAPGETDKLALDNCGACALAGRTTDEDHFPDVEGPNYAGWARVYVEASRTIPAKWERAFRAELASNNQSYADALRRSVATFGVRGLRFRLFDCACERGQACDVSHDPSACACLQCARASLGRSS